MIKVDDFKLLRGFDNGRTDEQTFVNVELLSRYDVNLVSLGGKLRQKLLIYLS